MFKQKIKYIVVFIVWVVFSILVYAQITTIDTNLSNAIQYIQKIVLTSNWWNDWTTWIILDWENWSIKLISWVDVNNIKTWFDNVDDISLATTNAISWFVNNIYNSIYDWLVTKYIPYYNWSDFSNSNIIYSWWMVWIWTSDPKARLHIVNNDNNIARFEDNNNVPWYIDISTDVWVGDDISIVWKAYSNTVWKILIQTFDDAIGIWDIDIYIWSTGNVGIWTTSPSEKLDVNWNIHVSGKSEIWEALIRTKVNWSYNNVYFSNKKFSWDNDYALLQNNDWSTMINSSDWNKLHFKINNQEKMILNGSWNLWIWNFDPKYTLDISWTVFYSWFYKIYDNGVDKNITATISWNWNLCEGDRYSDVRCYNSNLWWWTYLWDAWNFIYSFEIWNNKLCESNYDQKVKCYNWNWWDEIWSLWIAVLKIKTWNWKLCAWLWNWYVKCYDWESWTSLWNVWDHIYWLEVWNWKLYAWDMNWNVKYYNWSSWTSVWDAWDRVNDIKLWNWKLYEANSDWYVKYNIGGSSTWWVTLFTFWDKVNSLEEYDGKICAWSNDWYLKCYDWKNSYIVWYFSWWVSPLVSRNKNLCFWNVEKLFCYQNFYAEDLRFKQWSKLKTTKEVHVWSIVSDWWVRVWRDTSSCWAENVWTIRYKFPSWCNSTSVMYMCMQTNNSAYSWVSIKENSWWDGC